MGSKKNKPFHSGGPADRQDDPFAKNNIRFFSHSTEVFKHHIPTEYILLGVIELIVLIISFYIGIKLRQGAMPWHVIVSTYFDKAVIFGALMLSSLIAFGLYQRQSKKTLTEHGIRIASSIGAGFLVLSLLFYILPHFSLWRGELALAVLVSFISIMITRLLFMKTIEAYDLRLRVLVMGDGKTANLVKISRLMAT